MCFLNVNFHFQVQIMIKSIYKNHNIFFLFGIVSKIFSHFIYYPISKPSVFTECGAHTISDVFVITIITMLSFHLYVATFTCFSQLVRYSRACDFYHGVLHRGLLLTNEGVLKVKLVPVVTL